jgi:hypothetical protein
VLPIWRWRLPDPEFQAFGLHRLDRNPGPRARGAADHPLGGAPVQRCRNRPGPQPTERSAGVVSCRLSNPSCSLALSSPAMCCRLSTSFLRARFASGTKPSVRPLAGSVEVDHAPWRTQRMGVSGRTPPTGRSALAADAPVPQPTPVLGHCILPAAPLLVGSHTFQGKLCSATPAALASLDGHDRRLAWTLNSIADEADFPARIEPVTHALLIQPWRPPKDPAPSLEELTL